MGYRTLPKVQVTHGVPNPQTLPRPSDIHSYGNPCGRASGGHQGGGEGVVTASSIGSGGVKGCMGCPSGFTLGL